MMASPYVAYTLLHTHVGIPLATDKPAPVIITAGLPESNTDAMRLNASSILDRRCSERVLLCLFLCALFLIMFSEPLTLIDVSRMYYRSTGTYALINVVPPYSTLYCHNLRHL